MWKANATLCTKLQSLYSRVESATWELSFKGQNNKQSTTTKQNKTKQNRNQKPNTTKDHQRATVKHPSDQDQLAFHPHWPPQGGSCTFYPMQTRLASHQLQPLSAPILTVGKSHMLISQFFYRLPRSEETRAVKIESAIVRTFFVVIGRACPLQGVRKRNKPTKHPKQTGKKQTKQQPKTKRKCQLL